VATVLDTPRLLGELPAASPDCIPAAIEGRLTAGILRVLPRVHPQAPPENSAARPIFQFPPMPVSALLTQDVGFVKICELATSLGMVPAIVDLLKLGKAQNVVGLLVVSSHVVLAAQNGQAAALAGDLPRAIAGLITATPPVAPGFAADALFGLGFMRRELIKDVHAWKLGDSLQRLAKHSDPCTAAAARRLLFLVNEGLTVS
jgi:hypothetical protein